MKNEQETQQQLQELSNIRTEAIRLIAEYNIKSKQYKHLERLAYVSKSFDIDEYIEIKIQEQLDEMEVVPKKNSEEYKVLIKKIETDLLKKDIDYDEIDRIIENKYEYSLSIEAPGAGYWFPSSIC